jgi:recombinase
MAEPTSNRGPWTPADDQQLRALAESGTRLEDIAQRLNRTVGSVRMRAARLEVPLAKSGKLMGCPAWLKLSDDRTSFVILLDRAEIVRKVFELSAAGLGGYTIAKQLNAHGTPVFGPSPRWDQSTIHNMLSNRAAIGEYQPKHYAKATERRQGVRDRKGVATGDPVPGYYPAVIETDLFDRAQIARRENLASGRGRKGSLITNLFAGIPTCAYCGAPVKFHSNGNDKSLICLKALEERSCCRRGWSYKNFEVSFLKLLLEIDLEETAPRNQRELMAKLKALTEDISGSNIYDARLNLTLALKAAVSELRMASAGPTPTVGEPDERIRRDDPQRFFEVRFFGGTSHIVRPATLIRTTMP